MWRGKVIYIEINTVTRWNISAWFELMYFVHKRVMKIVEQAILSTDLALYFRKKDRFLDTANKGEIDWQEQEKKERKECLYFICLTYYT